MREDYFYVCDNPGRDAWYSFLAFLYTYGCMVWFALNGAVLASCGMCFLSCILGVNLQRTWVRFWFGFLDDGREALFGWRKYDI